MAQTITFAASAAVQCLFALTLTVGAAHALETWDGESSGGGSRGEAGDLRGSSVSERVEMNCGKRSELFDIPAGVHTGVAKEHTAAAYQLIAEQLYAEVGLARPSCDDSNCGFGQTCPSLGGSQTTSGGVSVSWRTLAGLHVDLEVKPGTKGELTCADCS